MSTTFPVPRTLRSDDVFFPAMGLVILAVVVLGFAQTYFFAGMLRAQLPSTLVHIHGALFLSWIFLVTIQPFLVALGKLKWHRTLGIFGVILPPLLVIFGVLTLFAFVRRSGTDADVAPELILTGDLEELALFFVLTSWALLVRRQASSHKRLMMMGTFAMLGPAIARWPIPFSPLGTICIQLGLPLLIVLYDLWSSRRIHRSTAIAYAMILISLLAVLPVSGLSFWQPLIAWIRHT